MMMMIYYLTFNQVYSLHCCARYEYNESQQSVTQRTSALFLTQKYFAQFQRLESVLWIVMNRQASRTSGIVLGLKEAAPKPKRVVPKKEPKAIIHFLVKDRPPFEAKIYDNILSYFDLQQAIARYLPRHRGVLTVRDAAKELISAETFSPCAEYFVREIDFRGVGEVNITRPIKWEFLNGYYAGPSDYIGKNGRVGARKGESSSAFEETDSDVDVFDALDRLDATNTTTAANTATITTTTSTATSTNGDAMGGKMMSKNTSPLRKR
jgi:hypothetical protein